jgi:DNA-binding NtrC family response regulator
MSVVTASILCIAEPAEGVILEHTLTRAGYRTVLVGSGEEAMGVVARDPLDLIIADYWMPGLARLEKEGHRIPFIVMVGSSSIEHAMPIESGVIDILIKPIQAETLEIAVRRALDVVRLRRENDSLRRELVRIRAPHALVGDSQAFRRVMEVVTTAAASRATVLLEGESGTGKKCFARAIHDQSPRADEPFITVGCAALPEVLVEGALFGHEEGALPGAFERAHGGTLLLDEISATRLEVQARLLRAIVEQQVERIGGQQPIRVDVRVIATTNRDLKAEVEAGRFRSDLYYRLNVLPIRAPTLRERMEDLPHLVRHFARHAAELQGDPHPAIMPETLEVLQRYPWPGNVRELATAVERAVLLCRGHVLQPGDLDRQIRDAAAHPRRPAIVPDLAGPGAEPADYNLDAIERLAIERALAATGGNRTRAARLLGISERTLRNKLNSPRAASGD